MSMRTLAPAAAILLTWALTLSAEEDLTAKRIMEISQEKVEADDQQSLADFKIVSKRGKVIDRKLETFAKQVSDDEERRFLRFLEPGDIKGTILLTYDREAKDKDDDMWLFLPALGKARRISASEKSDRFVGSDLTFEDMESIDTENLDFTILRSEEYGGLDCWVIEGVPGNEKTKRQSGYSKRNFWVDKEYFLVRQIHFFSKRKERHIKVSRFDDMRKIEGSEQYRLYRSETEDLVKGSKTIMTSTSIEINKGIEDKIFSKRMLK